MVYVLTGMGNVIKNLIQKMSTFDWKKNIEDSIKDGLIITATTTGMFYALEAASVNHQRRLWMLWIS